VLKIKIKTSFRDETIPRPQLSGKRHGYDREDYMGVGRGVDLHLVKTVLSRNPGNKVTARKRAKRRGEYYTTCFKKSLRCECQNQKHPCPVCVMSGGVDVQFIPTYATHWRSSRCEVSCFPADINVKPKEHTNCTVFPSWRNTSLPCKPEITLGASR
jgi:hypothetical protein